MLTIIKWKNNRGGFVDNLFSILNWDNARERLQVAMKLSLPLKRKLNPTFKQFRIMRDCLN